MKHFLVFLFSIVPCFLIAQKATLPEMLWAEAGGYIDVSEDHGGQYEIIDDAKNGYLKIAFTEDGCGCYFETTIGAFKNSASKYTTLKMDWNGCEWRKTLSSNKDLNSILPEDFGLHTFLPKSKETEYQITSAVYYLEAEIPRNGTDTRLDLAYVPFGLHMTPTDHILVYEYKQQSEHGATNFIYSEALQYMLQTISDENTLECILEQSIDNIITEDKKLVEELIGQDGYYAGIEELGAQIYQLKTVYEISKDIEYKSVIIGWNRAKNRFYIKEKIKNDAPEQSFLEFVRQLPFLMAIC